MLDFKRARMSFRPWAVAALTCGLFAGAACGGPDSHYLRNGGEDGSGAPLPPQPTIDGDLAVYTEPEPCAEIALVFTQVVPTVMLVVDQSGSMTASFDGTTRWDAVYDALMDDERGAIAPLAHEVRFGLALYTSYDGGPTCPVITDVSPALDNHAAIDSVFAEATPQEDTPTGEAIEALIPRMQLRAEEGPKVILLATDGEPDTCAVPDPQQGQPEAVAGVQAAYDAGIDVVVLAVGSELREEHHQQMANAGAGLDPHSACPDCAPIYRSQDQTALVEDFHAIIHGTRTCTFTLDGAIDPAYAHEGTVSINGTELDHGESWVANSETEIELLGWACEELLEGGEDVVEGTFPCHVVLEPPR